MVETAAIKQVFANRALTIPVSSIKSMIGETYSASGALAVAAAIGAIQRETLPPTMNYIRQDPLCDLDYIPGAARKQQVNHVLVIATDPYGSNSAIVVGR
jgi:3-oxoacyl-(acyl-carrier-protein) synthase